jgi:hypothetical protein
MHAILPQYISRFLNWACRSTNEYEQKQDFVVLEGIQWIFSVLASVACSMNELKSIRVKGALYDCLWFS